MARLGGGEGPVRHKSCTASVIGDDNATDSSSFASRGPVDAGRQQQAAQLDWAGEAGCGGDRSNSLGLHRLVNIAKWPAGKSAGA